MGESNINEQPKANTGYEDLKEGASKLVDAGWSLLKGGVKVNVDILTAPKTLGEKIGQELYEENKTEIDQATQAAKRLYDDSAEFNQNAQKQLIENVQNKPLTTALEFVTFPALPMLHAVINTATKPAEK